MLTLYTYFRSSAAFRVRIALNLKGLDWSPEVIWLPGGEQTGSDYRSVNVQGLVPTLVDGDARLHQSLAIIEYLDETKPGQKLLPADPLNRARVRSLSQLVACDIHPINNLRILNYLKKTLDQSQEAVDTWYRHWCDEGLTALEAELTDPRTGLFSHGDTVTMADLCLVPQVFNAQRFKVDMSRYPNVMRIFSRCMSMDAFSKAQPSAQPEASRTA